jgi:hypothetical protein
MTYFFTKEVFSARNEFPTALEGVDTVRKYLINLKLITCWLLSILKRMRCQGSAES